MKTFTIVFKERRKELQKFESTANCVEMAIYKFRQKYIDARIVHVLDESEEGVDYEI